MNKRNVRSFAFGVIFSVAIFILGFNFFENDNPQQAKELLEKDGYKVLTSEEYKQITSQAKATKENEDKEKIENSKEKKEKSSSNKNDDLITYELVVNRGMTTGEIASILKEKGIIKNQKDFEQYLVDVGYSNKIRVGKYKLNNKLSFREIALTITKQ